MELWNFWRESNDRFLREEGTSSENEATTGEQQSSFYLYDRIFCMKQQRDSHHV